MNQQSLTISSTHSMTPKLLSFHPLLVAVTCIFVDIALSAAGRPVNAQKPSTVARIQCERTISDSSHGVVRGIVVNDSTEQPVRHRAVFLVDTDCTTLTDSAGRFELRGVPTGKYRFSVAPLGYRRFTPLAVDVSGATPVVLEARLRPENRVADCRELPECAPILQATQILEGLADPERLRQAAFRTAVATIVGEGWRLGEFIACVEEPNARIMDALRAIIPKLAPASECALSAERGTGNRPALAHTPTGERAIAFKLVSTDQVGDRATVHLSYYVGPLYGAGWTCKFARERGEWVPRSCQMNRIS